MQFTETVSVKFDYFEVPKSLKATFDGSMLYVSKEVFLTSIPAEQLSVLCDEFRKKVFNVAGKQDPATMEGSPA